MSAIIKHESTQRTRTDDDPAQAEVGKWYQVQVSDSKDVVHKILMCVTSIGSNYVKFEGPSYDHTGSITSVRVHFDNFWEYCEYVPDPDPIIDGKIEEYKQTSRELMGEVHKLTALLGVAPRGEITDGGEVQALSIRSSEPTTKYKTALIKAKTETLPDLFEKIKDSNKKLGQWMKVKLIPMQAEAEALSGTVGLVEDRIFSVELYAGLVEEIEQVRQGEPAPNDEPVHLMQRRCYMDEECLVGYEHGGMDYKNIEDFEGWLGKPKNFERIFPFPRTLVAFRVRRHDKEREIDLHNFIQVMNEKKWDKTTFLYIRNGERLYRMSTEIEFEDQLFPDTNHKIFTSQKLWTRHARASSIEDIISDEELQGIIEDEKEDEIKKAKVPEKDRWHFHGKHLYSSDEYVAFTPESVYYDDIAAVISQEKKKHNRLVLIMQGLLDRSPVLHPHPPYQLWTHEGFSTAFRLHYDGSRAISDGDKPDFEKYRAKLNSFLTTGSLTLGQERVWTMREADRENKRRENQYTYGRRDHHEYTFFKPDGDPGPGKLAHVARYNERNGTCTYEWKRKQRGRDGYALRDKEEVEAKLVTGEENVLNVDAYRPGDFHIFFDDPRTRQEYLHWAPMLLEAEECHAGNRDLKPAKLLAPVPHPIVHRGERPTALNVPKPPKPRPSLGEKWEGKMVKLLRSITTKGGTKFKAGEILMVSGYHRRKLNLYDIKEKDRGVHDVDLYEVELLPDQPLSTETQT